MLSCAKRDVSLSPTPLVRWPASSHGHTAALLGYPMPIISQWQSALKSQTSGMGKLPLLCGAL